MRKKIEGIIIEFQEVHRACDLSEKPLKIVGGVDETFFKEMILVLMDLSSGYIFFEDASENRTYETWFKKTTDAVQKLNFDIQYFVSYRAKALIKLSETGFDCTSVPDLFHAEHGLSKSFYPVSTGKDKHQKQKIQI